MKLFISFLLLLLLGSCATLKRTSERHTRAKTDTSFTKEVQVIKRDTTVFFSRTVRDTTIVVPVRIVKDTVDATKPGAWVARQNGATLFTNVLPNGQVTITATCDSLLYVLEGQIEELKYQHSLSLEALETKDLKSSSSLDAQTETVKTGMSSGFKIAIIASVFLVLIIILGLIALAKLTTPKL